MITLLGEEEEEYFSFPCPRVHESPLPFRSKGSCSREKENTITLPREKEEEYFSPVFTWVCTYQSTSSFWYLLRALKRVSDSWIRVCRTKNKKNA